MKKAIIVVLVAAAFALSTSFSLAADKPKQEWFNHVQNDVNPDKKKEIGEKPEKSPSPKESPIVLVAIPDEQKLPWMLEAEKEWAAKGDCEKNPAKCGRNHEGDEVEVADGGPNDDRTIGPDLIDVFRAINRFFRRQ